MRRSILLPVWIFQFYTILSGLQPSSAQSQTDFSYNGWTAGITAGVLTAPGSALVRRHLPPILGIVAKKQISTNSNVIAEAHYSLCRETLAFTDWYDYYRPLFPSFRDPFCNPESIEYPRPPKAIRLHSFRLNLGYETSAASVLKLPVFVGGKVGLRFYKERWEYLAMMEYFKYRPPGSYSSEVPPLQPIRYTERSESQITVSLFGGLRFGDPNRGQRIYMEYSIPHELLQWISGDAPSQSTDEGLRIMLVCPVITLSGNREILNEIAGTKDIGSINLIIGKAGFSRGVTTQPGNSMYGFQLSRIISPRVFLDAEMSTIYWSDSRPRDYHILKDYELGLWWDRLTVDGRIWEFNLGPTVSVLGESGPQLSVGVSAGIRRQREFWDYDTKGWNLSLFWDTPPDNPGVQVDGILGLKLVFALSRSPTAVRAQIGFADKVWRITSGELKSMIDTSGYRLALLIPLGGLYK